MSVGVVLTFMGVVLQLWRGSTLIGVALPLRARFYLCRRSYNLCRRGFSSLGVAIPM